MFDKNYEAKRPCVFGEDLEQIGRWLTPEGAMWSIKSGVSLGLIKSEVQSGHSDCRLKTRYGTKCLRPEWVLEVQLDLSYLATSYPDLSII